MLETKVGEEDTHQILTKMHKKSNAGTKKRKAIDSSA